MIAVCLFATFLSTSFGFHIYIEDSVERCFIENVGERILITANYEYLGAAHSAVSDATNTGCSMYFRLPNGKINTRVDISAKPKGKFSYISETAGTHRICIYCSLGHWLESKKAKFFLSVETADALDKFENQRQYDFDNINPAKKHEIEFLISEIQKFTHSVSSIKDEQVLDDFITNKFYRIFNTVHEYILYFYMAQIAAICICVAYSINHLNKYFKSQRLI
ncbi:Transmembrane emp24 domain-containing protein eca [Babesia microti strain RI]|uniref:Transmembrane emp24 domain-containing protein eca n=1 Tax=Babesia microti (strain RI) TaxID=1133968 RepID=A0A1N6LWL1_BABMR|nr:Transmembrane emp24 domain-containing protein eca [Babesia microti strain RI]SIO73260.1 Transmembrane emp24 domain-containing protein eca [Babesia microti strain RI]|eukprot:XP_012647313.2 Transmembrane emp24 domain-containing protein eca [Babesia microti strain RI]